MEFISKLIQAVAEAVLPIVAVYLAALVKRYLDKLSERVQEADPDAYQVLSAACLAAVRSAEQVFGGKAGEQKKLYAMKMVEGYLSQHGITLNLELIGDFVESAVYDEFGRWDRLKVGQSSIEPEDVAE